MGYEEDRERRRNPPEPEPYQGDRGPEVVADKLASQLGTEPKILDKGQHDMTLLSVFDDKDVVVMLYSALRGRKARPWRMIYELYPKLKVSIGGRGRRDIIRMEAVSKGGMPSVESEIPGRPGWIGRNITQRGWKERWRENQI